MRLHADHRLTSLWFLQCKGMPGCSSNWLLMRSAGRESIKVQVGLLNLSHLSGEGLRKLASVKYTSVWKFASRILFAFSYQHYCLRNPFVELSKRVTNRKSILLNGKFLQGLAAYTKRIVYSFRYVKG